MLKKLKDYYVPRLQGIEFEGLPVEPPVSLPWYPNEMGWQMTTSKSTLRKFPPFAEFQRFLVSETGVGNISRQEAVSMIPPLVLDVRPGMTVLDVCAAPGSKTAQLIEMIHDGEEGRIRKIVNNIHRKEGQKESLEKESPGGEKTEEQKDDGWSDYGRSTGLVIANDVDYKRCHLLIHQTKRLNSPNIIVMNHDATQFPSIKIGSETDKSGNEVNKYLKFDRILVDVPCSGDGTARKNPNIWRDWTPANAFGLHPVQCRILVRALQMLKVGGRIVYSTCSMHPVENESVIASSIDRCGGMSKIELIDTSTMLPGLKRSPGLTSWKIIDKTGRLWDSWKDVMDQKNDIGMDGLGKMAHTMFPDYLDEALPLERCMRVYPHQQDTGGFFIAVLEKKADFKARAEGQPKVGHAVEVAEALEAETTMREAEEKTETKPSIMAIVNEIESSIVTASDPSPHIAAIDQILPPTEGNETEMQNSVVAFEHPIDQVAGQKRLAEDADDAALAPTKKIKIHGENGFSAHQGGVGVSALDGERQIHWPPPPAISNSQPAINTDKGKKDRFFEEPFKYLAPDQANLEVIYKFYGLDSRFPRDRFLARNGEGIPSKAIYYTSNLAKTVLQENEGKGFRFVHCGIKAFVKQDVPRPDVCKWRIQTEGVPLMEPWVKEERILTLSSKKTFHKLLIEMFPRVGGEAWQRFDELGKTLRDCDLGCYVLRIEAGEGDDAFEERMVLPIWRSVASVNLMLPKEERKAMLLRLYNDTSPLIDGNGSNNRGKDKPAVETADEDQEMPDSPAAVDEEDKLQDDESDGGVALNGLQEATAGD